MAADVRQYSENAILRDGGSILVRAVEPADKERVLVLFSRLSEESIRHRFFGGKKALTPKELAYFTEVDFTTHVALAAILREDGEERMIGVARYIRLPPSATATAPAEVAFVVVDAHQGRGIGPVLLEHLAAIAASAGVDELDAEVMGDNTGMMRVFSRSGFIVKRTMSSSVYSVTFPTAATAAFVQASDDRERHASAESLHVFFEPLSIAVVRASPKPGSVGRTILANLRRRGYRGPLYPVHPTAREIDGLACGPSVNAVSGHVDLAILAVPARAVEEVIGECGRAGVRGVVVVSADFTRPGEEGGLARSRLRQVVRTAGMRMLGPASLGVMRTDVSAPLDALVSSTWPRAGGVSMFCEGAALGIALLDRAAERGLGIADFVSAGDKADVSGNDLLSYWSNQPSTKVIALCLESVGNPRKFVRIARAVALRKPVLVMTSSTSADVAAVLAEARVPRAGTTNEIFDMLARWAPPPGPVGVTRAI